MSTYNFRSIPQLNPRGESVIKNNLVASSNTIDIGSVDSRFRNLYLDGIMYASNVVVEGDFITVNAVSSNSEQMVITNLGTGPALIVKQSGAQAVAEFIDAESGSALYVGNNGNVGIGTGVGFEKLQVEGNIALSGGNRFVGTRTNNTLSVRTNNLDRIVVDTQGNVGIGTTVASAMLHILETGNRTAFRVDDVANDTTPFIINADGNVGIGTTVARSTLEVNGSVLPSACNVYDLGSSTQRFRDLYLSGSTIDLAGTQIGTAAGNIVTVPGLTTTGNIVSSGTLSSGTGFMFRNKIINGDFRINQRGTSTNLASLTAVGATFGYVADRWGFLRGGFATGAVMAQGTNLGTSDLPYTAAGIKTFGRMGRLSGNTGIDTIYCAYALESQDSYSLAGKTVTVSFYYRTGANFSGTALIGDILTGTGIDEGVQRGGSMTGIVTAVVKSFSPSTSWTYGTFTATLSTNITQVCVRFYYTPVGTAGANDWFDITGVQLELGSVATPFELRPFGVELAMCQRYFYGILGSVNSRHILGPSFSRSTTLFLATVTFPVTMRKVPDLTSSNGTGHFNTSVGGGDVNSSYVEVAGGFTQSVNNYGIAAIVAGPLTLAQGGVTHLNSTSAFVFFNAEL